MVTGRRAEEEHLRKRSSSTEEGGRVRSLHWGHLIPGIVLSLSLSVFLLSVVPFTVEAWRDWREAAMLCFILCPIGVAIVLMLGFHTRCPRCRNLFARKVLSKSYSYSATRQETYRDSTGGQRTRTVSSKIYRGSFRCRSCDHTWQGVV